MILFLGGLALLVVGYFTYGRLVERIVGLRAAASVCDLAAKRGVGSVRVDTHPDNRAMRAALEKAGFTACGELLLDRCEEAGDPRVGYERILQ